MNLYSSGPWHVASQGNPHASCRLVQTSTGKTLALFCQPGLPNSYNAQLASRSTALLAMLRWVRETCHLTEDTTLARDIDALIADATGADGPPSDEDEEEIDDV